MSKKYRVKSKFRFTLFLTVSILCVIIAGSTLLGLNNANASSMNQYYAVKVSVGDTLWDIAEEYGPEYQDVRKTVDEICQLNEMEASDLTVGEHILVPVYQ